MKNKFARAFTLSLIATVLFGYGALAQWDDSWKKQYPVGAKLMCSPSYNDADWREGVVTENWPGGVFKVKVPAGNGYPGGVFIISSESAVKPIGGNQQGAATKQEPAPTQNAPQPAAHNQAPHAPNPTAKPNAVPEQNFASHADAQKCECNEAALKQVLLERERGKSPLQKPTIDFHSFEIGKPLPGYDPAVGFFLSNDEAHTANRRLKTVIPVKTHYSVHEHYTDSTKVSEFDQTFYFFKDDTGDCVAANVKGRFISEKYLPAGSP